MTISSFHMLPPPPPDRIKWPWRVYERNLPIARPEEVLWPRITVVTVSYNQAQFLEETLRSVLLQGYPNLEYIVIDGGSTDGSLQIIERYQKYFAYWVSESDNGQSHAINKGFEKATGEILCWLNSDDFLQPGALAFVAQQFQGNPPVSWLIGATEVVAKDGQHLDIRQAQNVSYNTFFTWPEEWFPQQSTFWTRQMWEKVKPLDEHLHYVMDLALWLSMYDVAQPIIVPQVLSAYRYQAAAKCIAQPSKIPIEIESVLKKYFQTISATQFACIKKELIKLDYAQAFSQRLLYWVHDNYNNTRSYDAAKYYLRLAIQLNPLLLTNSDIFFLRTKLSLGKGFLNALKTIKRTFRT
jgi:glycosyltransferase involved in cell wall biosynthesis